MTPEGELSIAKRTKLRKFSTGAIEGTRTPTPLPVHGPEPCASANSATMASGLQLRQPERRRIRKTCTSILQATIRVSTPGRSREVAEECSPRRSRGSQTGKKLPSPERAKEKMPDRSKASAKPRSYLESSTCHPERSKCETLVKHLRSRRIPTISPVRESSLLSFEKPRRESRQVDANVYSSFAFIVIFAFSTFDTGHPFSAASAYF
jgi:hypothetical protein